jgi:hypothetical protein
LVRKIFTSKVFILFTSLFIIGFFIGYDYAHITYEPDDAGYLIQPADLYSQIEKNNTSQSENNDMDLSAKNNINTEYDNSMVPENSDNADVVQQDYVNQNNENSEKPGDMINPSGDSAVNPSEPSN